jgi:protein involved in polysaccharide export with SLBB domain
LIGQKNSIDNLSIKEDGSINIPEIGKLYLSGLSLEDANKLIKAKSVLLI